jgi:hypothetical protein
MSYASYLDSSDSLFLGLLYRGGKSMITQKEKSLIHINALSKGFISKIIGACALLLVSTGSWGYLVGGASVGGLDTFIGSEQPLAGTGNPEGETAWANALLSGTGETVTFTVKSLEDATLIFDTDSDSNIRAFELIGFGDPLVYPDYFLVKNANYRALFENVSESSWGVFDLNFLTLESEGVFNLDGASISHVTEFDASGGVVVNVPAPAALLLLGLGLIGFSVTRRKITRKS